MGGMSDRRFEILVERSLDLLPEEIKRYLKNIVVVIEDEPDLETLHDLGFTEEEIEAGERPYGLYEAVVPEMDEYLLSDLHMTPHRIVIYKKPLVRDFPTRQQLMIEIRKTVVHEVCHRLGLSDDDLEEFDDHPNPFSDDEKGE